MREEEKAKKKTKSRKKEASEEGRKRRREEERKRGREEGRKRGREEGRKGEREEGRKGGIWFNVCLEFTVNWPDSEPRHQWIKHLSDWCSTNVPKCVELKLQRN